MLSVPASPILTASILLLPEGGLAKRSSGVNLVGCSTQLQPALGVSTELVLPIAAEKKNHVPITSATRQYLLDDEDHTRHPNSVAPAGCSTAHGHSLVRAQLRAGMTRKSPIIGGQCKAESQRGFAGYSLPRVWRYRWCC
jgi:hypothetical protein